jgi:hypothetical protein
MTYAARRILDAARDGQDVSIRSITFALIESGDIDTKKGSSDYLTHHLITIYSDGSCNQPEIKDETLYRLPSPQACGASD